MYGAMQYICVEALRILYTCNEIHLFILCFGVCIIFGIEFQQQFHTSLITLPTIYVSLGRKHYIGSIAISNEVSDFP